MDHAALTLFDPRSGDLALRVTDLALDPGAGPAERSNYFTVLWVQSGHGAFWADGGCHPFAAPALLFFVPYQYTRFVPEQATRGVRIQFHANFLCVETYHDEIGCNGVLFNDVYGVPAVALDASHVREVSDLVGHMRRELTDCGLAHSEILLSYLKVLLIRATRLKLEQGGGSCAGRLPPVLQQLRELIEAHYRQLHSPADYARLLHTDPGTLGKTVKAHLHKTLTELIRERVLKHARWDLLHTLKPVKQIARELGYADELYFSRLFKLATGQAPLFFREYETAIRGGTNLSMPSPRPSIPSSAAEDQNTPSVACEP